MQGSKTDTFIKTQKQAKRFDDGTGKRQNPKKSVYTKEMRQKNQKH